MMKKVGCKTLPLFLVILLFLAACGGSTEDTPGSDSVNSNGAGDASEEAVEEAVDPDSGLLVNPDENPDGPFIVEGEINSLNLTPQTSPEFVVKADNGKNYRIRAQDLAATYFDDGEAVAPSELRQGMRARATVTYDAGQLIYFSDDFLFLRGEE